MKVRIPIRPMASPRPRLGRNGVHMPKKYMQHKKDLQAYYVGLPRFTNEELKMDITFAFKRSKSYNKNKYAFPVGDVDNLIKTVWDSMNGILFEDDVQITQVCARKIYSDVDYIEFNLMRA